MPASSSKIRSVLIGTGAYLPQRILTNRELAASLDSSDEWIRQRTGISQRHVSSDSETTTDLATRAAKQAMVNAGIRDPSQIDLVIVATTTPTDVFPATATMVQHFIGASGFAFDLQAVCSGFVYALSVADSLLQSGSAKTALVIGAENFTRLLDWTDRGTCVLFGDGAGAVIVRAEAGKGDQSDRGILTSFLHSDGSLRDILYTDGSPGARVKMEGKEVFRHATEKMAAVAEEALDSLGLQGSDLDWLVPHQANLRIIEAMAKKLNLPLSKVIVTVDKHANTSAASIPLALHAGFSDGRLKPGQLIMVEALGGGLTWGSAIIRL
ncbi:MAG: beta-ketoacyl-ACP synthase III [Candidatus Pacebacteria bacterium]|nr:beta-ketoacyl-ACP synthase III [Candidatus Paceibacterota bacterium]